MKKADNRKAPSAFKSLSLPDQILFKEIWKRFTPEERIIAKNSRKVLGSRIYDI